jgi:hypothetical protein
MKSYKGGMMVFNWDFLTAINLLLCVVILTLGYFGFKKSKNTVIPYISLAFGLFGISHLLSLFCRLPEDILIAIRMFAYLLVILASSKAARIR